MKRIFTYIFYSLFLLIFLFVLSRPVKGQYAVNYTISGVVFNDLNSNGVRDVGEPGVQNVTVTIGALNRTTDVNGNYTFFQQFSAGTYSVVRTLPGGYISTSPSPLSRTVGPDQTANFGIKPISTFTVAVHVRTLTTPQPCTTIDSPTNSSTPNVPVLIERPGNSYPGNTGLGGGPAIIPGVEGSPPTYNVSINPPAGYVTVGWSPLGSGNTITGFNVD